MYIKFKLTTYEFDQREGLIPLVHFVDNWMTGGKNIKDGVWPGVLQELEDMFGLRWSVYDSNRPGDYSHLEVNPDAQNIVHDIMLTTFGVLCDGLASTVEWNVAWKEDDPEDWTELPPVLHEMYERLHCGLQLSMTTEFAEV